MTNMKIDFFYFTKQESFLEKLFESSYDISFYEEKLGGGFLHSSKVFESVLQNGNAPFLLVQISKENSYLTENTIRRFLKNAYLFGPALFYSNYFENKNDNFSVVNLIRYQMGSVRDDFNFGKFILISRELLKKYFMQKMLDLHYSAFYDFVLFASRETELIGIPEALYYYEKSEERKTGEAVFDYVKNEFVKIQSEREEVFTNHLKKIGAFLLPSDKTINFSAEEFPVTASVIIPVKNREKTIADALNSALNQRTDFPFNVIVVDNHSSDSTTSIIRKFGKTNNNLIHIIPEEKHLGIGGCWNIAINEERCGAFAVQLDSDDIYSDKNSLQKIINKFYETKTAAVIGSYTVTDFNLNPIPPGEVTHREWTEENGHNNALRLNGFGAPRAYYTPVIRKIGFPDVSYGEDYAVMLEISREYKIGRIFSSIYFARRWENNSDADLEINTKLKYDFYKDFLRTAEIKKRIKLNKGFA